MFKCIYNGEKEKAAGKNVFGATIKKMVQGDSKVVYLDADLMNSIGTFGLDKDYPDQIVEVGIQEANMVGVAAGMSAAGMKPVVHTFGSFAGRRVFDQAFMSVAYAKNNVVIVGSDSGINAAYNGDYAAIEDSKLVLNEKISRRQVSLGKTVDCKAKIEELTAEVASLESAATVSSVISAESSGYFVGKADGYENIITVADIENLTPATLTKALNAKKASVPENTVGKIINGYNWYVATVIDTGKVVGFDEGKAIKLILGGPEAQTVTTKVHSVKAVEGNKSLVVFRCNLMNDTLTSLRKVSGKVVINEHTGLKISKDALRFDADGNAGVYVRRANIINFRSVNILYTDDKCIVAAYKEGVELEYPHLELYDEVIISGKDLSDGMVIG